jgi:uncharacterized protein
MTDAADLVQEMGRLFQSGDQDAAFALVHPQVRLYQPLSLPHGGWHEGRAGMTAAATEFAKHWDRTVSDMRVYGSGEQATQVTTQTWTAKSTGRSARVEVAELFTAVDGRIAQILVFQQDTFLLMSTLEPA